MSWLLFITVASILIAESAAVNCRSGWRAHGQKCYLFSHGKQQWVEARSVCEGFGGYLAEVPSMDDNEFLKREVNGDELYWLGGNDIEEEGVWVWPNAKVHVSGFTAWKPNEPNNANSNENCMGLGNVGWNDDNCMDGKKYICEMDGVEVAVVG